MGKQLSKSDLKLYSTIDKILWEDWDPIGIHFAKESARDEYYSYLPKVFEMVKSGKSRQEISNYLFTVEKNLMGLPGNKEKCDKIAKQILDIS